MSHENSGHCISIRTGSSCVAAQTENKHSNWDHVSSHIYTTLLTLDFFFTVERLVLYAACFILVGVIGIVLNKRG